MGVVRWLASSATDFIPHGDVEKGGSRAAPTGCCLSIIVEARLENICSNSAPT